MPHRYFTTEISDGTATLRGADAHHLARVMRARLGDTVILCDGNAVEYTATITGFGDECVEFRVEPGYPSAAEPSVEVTLLAGYPKQDKLEQIIKHGVELGAAHIVPFFSRYCVAAPKKEAGSSLVCFLDPVFGRGVCQLMFSGDPLDPLIQISMYKYTDRSLIIRKRVICTASNYNAGSLRRQLFDRVKLCKEHFVVDGHIGKCRRGIAKGICIHNQGIQKTVGWLFIIVLE